MHLPCFKVSLSFDHTQSFFNGRLLILVWGNEIQLWSLGTTWRFSDRVLATECFIVRLSEEALVKADKAIAGISVSFARAYSIFHQLAWLFALRLSISWQQWNNIRLSLATQPTNYLYQQLVEIGDSSTSCWLRGRGVEFGSLLIPL